MVAMTITLYGQGEGARLRCDVCGTQQMITDTDMGTLISIASPLFTDNRAWVMGVELPTVFKSSELARKRVSRLKAELASPRPLLLNNRRGAYRLNLNKDDLSLDDTIWPWIEEAFGASYCDKLRSAYRSYKTDNNRSD